MPTVRSAYFTFTAVSYLLISQIQNRKNTRIVIPFFYSAIPFYRIKIMLAGAKTGLTNKKDQSTGQKKRSVYQTNSGKYFVSVLRRIDSVIGFTSTSLAPAFIAFSLSELKA